MTKQKAAHLNESPFSVVTAYAADNKPDVCFYYVINF